MDTFFVILDPVIEIENIELEVQDQEIRATAERYRQAQQKADQLKVEAEDRLLAGTAGTIYLKKKGHRPLSVTDVEQIIRAMGNEEDNQSLTDFTQAQINLSQRLQGAKNIGLILEQAGITYMNYYKRLSQPELWKAEQMIAIVDVLDRLRV